MASVEWKDEFVEGFVNLGLAKGRAEAIDIKISDILKVLVARELRPTKKQLSQVATCTDLATLNRWFDRSLIATTADEVFAD